MKNTVKVMLIDDSALVRKVMSEILNHDKRFSICATAADPIIAFERLKTVTPDVILLDLEMPRMDGITFLSKFMPNNPIPVVVCSSVAEESSENAIRALELGALDIVSKPQIGIKSFFEESKIRITDALFAAAGTNIDTRKQKLPPHFHSRSPTADVEKRVLTTTEKVIAVGASTGGTEAIRIFIESLPKNPPGVVIVQHMPEKFTKAFADRLNSFIDLDIREASGGEEVRSGSVLIAPGNRHMIVKRIGAVYRAELIDGPLVSRHRPSVDVLFRSVARNVGKNAIGCILTGMGSDGSEGLLEMRNSGAYTLGQSEQSSVVFGMPGAAAKIGAVCELLDVEDMGSEIFRYLSGPRKRNNGNGARRDSA